MPKGGGAYCAVAGCSNQRKNTEGISFHRFPKDSKLKKVWILKCYRADKFNVDQRSTQCTICSNHFKEEDFERDLKAELLNLKPRQILKEGSIPSQNLPKNDLPRTTSGIKRNERRMAKEAKQKQEEIISSLLQSSPSKDHSSHNVKKKYLKKNVVPSLNLPLTPAELKARKAQQEERDALAPNVVHIKKVPQRRGRWCAVAGCRNRKGNTVNVSFFCFPKDPDLKKEWILRCCRTKSFKSESGECTICSIHFKKEDFQQEEKPGPLSSKPRRVLKKGSIPSQNLPKDFSHLTSPGIESCRIDLQKERKEREESNSSIFFPSSSNESQSSRSTISTKQYKMTSKCCVSQCKSDKCVKEESVAVFNFPTTEPLKSLWLKGIRRYTFTPSKHSVVCEKHFKPSDVIRDNSASGGKRNKLSTGCKPRLRKGAVPSIMGEAQHSAATSRFKTLAAKRTQNSNNAQETPAESNVVRTPTIVKFQQCEVADESSEAEVAEELNEEEVAYDSDETDVADETMELERINGIDFIDLTELEQKLRLFDLGDFWTLAKGKRSLAFVHITWTNVAPKIHLSVVIDEHLLVSVFHGEERIKVIKDFSFPLRVRNMIALETILAKAKLLAELESSSTVELVQRLLDTLKQNTKKHRVALSFLKEQVSLLTDKKKLYSPDMLIFATLLFAMAPHAYKFLTHYENLILPELDIIKNLYIPSQTSSNKKVSPIKFLKHAKESFCSLKDSDKHIVLQMEEIYLKPFLEVDGNIAGMSVKMDNAATSVYTFMITSLCSNYKDTVYLLPVKSLKAKDIHNVLKEVIVGLECIGFQIIAVVTDASLVSRQAMSLFSEPPLFNSIIYKHPVDSSRPLFHLISYAHLLKDIRNEWMIQNNQGECISYPAIEDETDKQSIKKASFSTVKKLHEVESSSYLKSYSCISSKAIFPSNADKHNIEFVLQIFNDNVSNRLLLYGEDHNLPNYQDTSDFIKLICTWWTIVNPDSSLKEANISDLSYGALSMSEKSYAFLQKFLDWLDCWSNKEWDSGMLTAKTFSALHLSTYALIELTAYCKNELGMNFILPGNFQTDYRITKLGYSSELSSIQYVHKKKWPVSEPKLKTWNNLSLTLIEVNDVNITRLHWKQTVNLTETIDYVNTFIPMIITDEDITSNQVNIPVLLYLGGYCVRSVLKELNCQQCKSRLTTDVDMVLHPAVSENDTNEDPLKYPSKNAMNIVFLSFVVLSKLCKEHDNEFWTHTNRISVAYNLTMNILESIELGLDYRFCGSGHSSSQAVKMIVRSVVYNVLKNHHEKSTSEHKSSNVLETLLIGTDNL